MSGVTAAGKRDVPAIGPGVTRALARHAATLQYEALPPALVELIKQCVMDTLGVSIGASTLAPEAAILDDYVADMGGKPEATILGFGGKAPAAWATFVNGSLGHMLDYDDMGESGHPSIVTIPVALAVAEKLGGVDWPRTDYGHRRRHGRHDAHQPRDRRAGLDDDRGLVRDAADRLRRRRRDRRPAAEARPGADGERARHRLQPDERHAPDGRGRSDTHALDAGRLLRPGRCARGGTRAARHHRLEGLRRGPLRLLQDLHSRLRARLGRDRGRARREVPAAREARLQGVAGVRLHAHDECFDAGHAGAARPQARGHRVDHHRRRHRRHAATVRAARQRSAGPRSASTASSASRSRPR